MNKKHKISRSDIDKAIAKKFPSLPKDKISQALNAILESIIESIEIDEKIEIRGFGTFSKKYIRPRKFINPKTKAIDYIGETATVHFKPSKSLIRK